MKILNFVIAAATAAALPLTISNAASEKTSVEACASAFATSIAAPGAATPGFKLAYRSSFSATTLDYARDYSFVLEARDKAGVAIARASCLTDSKGLVTSISTLPLSAQSSSLAAAAF